MLKKYISELRLSWNCRLTSIYRWKGSVETAAEVPVLIKTLAARYGEVEAFIRSHHPYELPEVIALSLDCGLPAYLAWVAEQTQPAAPHIVEQA